MCETGRNSEAVAQPAAYAILLDEGNNNTDEYKQRAIKLRKLSIGMLVAYITITVATLNIWSSQCTMFAIAYSCVAIKLTHKEPSPLNRFNKLTLYRVKENLWWALGYCIVALVIFAVLMIIHVYVDKDDLDDGNAWLLILYLM